MGDAAVQSFFSVFASILIRSIPAATDTDIDPYAYSMIYAKCLMEKDAQTQIEKLEGQIQQLRSTQVGKLREKLKEARREVARLEAALAKVSGKPVSPGKSRKRTPSAEVRERIVQALNSAPGGLGQKEISDRTSLNYNTVVLYLKNHKKDFKSAGSLRARRFFLKK